MRRYVIRRLLLVVPVLMGITLLVFIFTRVLPGDAALAQAALEGGRVTQEDLKALHAHWGLDQPIHEQYGRWLKDLGQGNLGNSWSAGRPVSDILQSRIEATLNLVVFSMTIALLIGIPLGIISAYKRNTPADYVARIISIAGIAIPSFWLGLVLILGLTWALDWSPPLAYVRFFDNPLGNLEKMILPSFILGYGLAALIARMTRTAILEVLREDYVRTARAKGLSESIIARRHIFRNAALPIITVVGVYLALMSGGVVVIEKVFNIQGLGSLLVQAVGVRDYPIVQAMLLLTGAVVSVVNLCVDLAYGLIDPRIRYG